MKDLPRKEYIYRVLLYTFILFFILLTGKAYSVTFSEKDTRIDLPVLDTPNNAVTPDIASDDSGHVYVVWSDNRGGSPAIYINVYFPGQGWLPRAIQVNTGFPRPSGVPIGEATLPQVCADNNGNVYVAWVDDRAVKAGTGQRDIYFRYSKDYGITWHPEYTDERIDTDSPVASDSINPRIACDEGGNIYFTWEDNRNSSRRYEVYFRSLHINFSKPTDFIEYYQFPDLRINTGVTAGWYEARFPAISTDGNGHVYIAWQDSRDIAHEETYPGIYFNVSNNHGATWLPEAIRIDRGPIGYHQSLYPAISNDPRGHVYVAWLDNGGRAERGNDYAADGTFDVYFNRSSDYGLTWEDKDIRINSTGPRADVKDVAIASSERGFIYIVWADNRLSDVSGKESHYNIFLNHSENYGKSFLDTDENIRIDTGVDGGTTSPSQPRIQVDKYGHVFVAWTDYRTNYSDIYFNFSIKRGQAETWQVPDLRIDNPRPPGNSINHVLSIDDNGNVYLAWQDTRDTLAKDTYNIYARRGFLDIEAILVEGQRVAEACFIATAAYGSPYERHVKTLRDFRDRYLLTNGPGKWIVAQYYRLSPPAAHFIASHPLLKPLVRFILVPVVGIAYLLLITTPIQKLILFTLAVLLWDRTTITH